MSPTLLPSSNRTCVAALICISSGLLTCNHKRLGHWRWAMILDLLRLTMGVTDRVQTDAAPYLALIVRQRSSLVLYSIL